MGRVTTVQNRVLRRLRKKPLPPEFFSFSELVSIEEMRRRGFVRAVVRTLRPSWVVWLLYPKCHGWLEVLAITPAGRRALQDSEGRRE